MCDLLSFRVDPSAVCRWVAIPAVVEIVGLIAGGREMRHQTEWPAPVFREQ